MRSFYLSLVTSSFICLSIACASSVLEETQTASTSSTSLSATTSQVTPKDELTSFTDRLKVVREYYGEKPFNKDPTIFTHIAKWHDQDVKAIASRLTSEENRAKLSKFSAVLAQTFDRGEASFAKVSAAYLLYARVLSRDIEPCTDSAILDYHAKQNQSVLRYIQDGSLDGFYNDWVVYASGFYSPLKTDMLGYEADLRALSKDVRYEVDEDDKFFTYGFFEVFENILLLSKFEIRTLPMVSQTALATYEELDESFGLGTPLLGMALRRGNYDGNFDELPEDIFEHDVKHALFNDQGHPERVGVYKFSHRYVLYRQFNNATRQIQDPQRRFLSHFFLFDIGHESGFVDENSKLETDQYDPSYEPIAQLRPLLNKNNADRIFQDYAEKLIQNIGHMSETKSFASLWAYARSTVYYENGQRKRLEYNENYYRTQSVWRYMVNESTGNLYTPEEMFTQFDLDRTTYLRGETILAGINKKLRLNLTFNGFNDEREFEGDMIQWQFPYNILIENQTYFQQNGLTDFQVWKGDKINVEGIKAQLQKAVDVFKEDVLPKL